MPDPDQGGGRRLYLAGGYAGLESPAAPDTRDIDTFETHLRGDPQQPIVRIESLEPFPGDCCTPLSAIDLGRVTSFEGLRFADNQAITIEALPRTPVIVDRCVFTNCSTDGNGGAIYADGASFLIRESLFEGCSAPYGDGGAVFHTGDILGLKDSLFVSNTAENGGAIATSGARDFGFSGSRFVGNVATASAGLGGAVYDRSGGFPVHIGAEFEGNSAGAGGAMWTSATTIFDLVRFDSNEAGTGGALYIADSFGGQANLYRGCAFLGNQATFGGAVAVATRDRFHDWIDTTFDLNQASLDGGAIFITGGGTASSRHNFRSTVFRLNTATRQGGGVFTRRMFTMRDTQFSNNFAAEGGAIAALAGGAIADSSFVFNTGDRGGAIHGALDITESLFEENFAAFAGGALYGASTVQDSVFVANGAGVEGGAASQIASASDSEFTGNRATIMGGAIDRLETGTNLVFTGNRSLYGAAISNLGSSLTDSRFVDNPASSVGGRGTAVYHDVDTQAAVSRVTAVGPRDPAVSLFHADDGRLIVQESLVLGGASAARDGRLDLAGCTVDRRWPEQQWLVDAEPFGSVAVESSVVGASNSLRVAPDAELLVAQVLVPGGIDAVSQGAGSELIVVGEILDASPGFVDREGPDGSVESWEDNDYRPAPSSRLIDAGFGFGIGPDRGVDLAGSPRVADDPTIPNTNVGVAPIDIGAFEFQGISCPADVNRDGVLGPGDFTAWINAYNRGSLLADLNRDGALTPDDFSAWIAAYNDGCP